MKTVEIIGFKRANLESGDLKQIREEGSVPCVVYGPAIKEQIHFHTPAILFKNLVYTPDVHIVDLNIEGEKLKAVLKDTQFHPVSDTLLHADFLAFSPDRPIKFEIPVEVVGTAPGVQKGGKLEFKTRRVAVKGLAANLPDKILVDVSNLDLGKSFRIGDLKPEAFEILTSPNVTVVTIGIPRALRGKKD